MGKGGEGTTYTWIRYPRAAFWAATLTAIYYLEVSLTKRKTWLGAGRQGSITVLTPFGKEKCCVWVCHINSRSRGEQAPKDTKQLLSVIWREETTHSLVLWNIPSGKTLESVPVPVLRKNSWPNGLEIHMYGKQARWWSSMVIHILIPSTTKCYLKWQNGPFVDGKHLRWGGYLPATREPSL